jgi:signal peptidase I
LEGGRFRLAVAGTWYAALEGVTMARRSKTRDNDTSAVTVSSNTEDGSPGSVARPRFSKFAILAKWLRRIFSTIVVLVVLAAVGVGSVALIHGTWQVNPIVSGSMRPGLPVGGAIISERVPVDQLLVRDVIVFRSPDNPADLIVHRIVAMSRSNSGQLVIKTQGDANNVRDAWTLTIRGNHAYVARWSVPLLGYLAVAFENNRGLVLLAAGIVLIAAAASAILKQRRHGEAPEEPDESESTRSLDTAATSPTSAVEDATVASSIAESDANPFDSTPENPASDREDAAVPSSIATSDANPMESSVENPGESEPPIDAPSPQKPQWRHRFGMKED